MKRKILEEISKISNKLLSYFNPEEIEELGISTKFINRKRKLKGFDFLLSNILSVKEEGFKSLSEQLSHLNQLGVILKKVH